MRLAPAIALTATAMFALAACQPDATPIVPTPAPSSSPIFASDEEALAAAADAYRAYLEVSDQILADGGKNPERLREFATDEVVAQEAESYFELEQNKWTATGYTAIDTISLQSVTSGPTSGQTVVTVYACVDVSATSIVDTKGNSVVGEDRRTRFPFQSTFEYDADLGHLVLSEKLPWSGEDFCAS
jgi:hypothetical protein